MSEFEQRSPVRAPEPPEMQGLLLTGEGLNRMTPERLQVLGEMVGALGLRLTTLGEPDSVGCQGEQVLSPVPATKESFRDFAAENGYTRQLANRSFNATIFTGIPRYRLDNPNDPFPPVRFIGDEYAYILDLRSIHQRLVASDMTVDAWVKCGKGMLNFLVHIVNEQVETDDPLPINLSRKPLST